MHAPLIPNGLDTPKFNEDDSLGGAEENVYTKKRLLLQARKDFYAAENYRSETNPVQPHYVAAVPKDSLL